MTVTLETLAADLARGALVPYLGPGALAGSSDPATGEPIPADSDSLILAMNNGKPMSPRLMWEFPRAAMDVELKRGRGAVHRFLNTTYAQRSWTRSALHDWLGEIHPPYVIDINRDLQLQDSYADRPHTLIRGIARTGGTDYRFRLHAYDGETYREVDQTEVDPSLPILFKPMGSPRPDETYIASDADYVDYLTELMGGFGIPAFVKSYRAGKQYLFLGLRFLRDTERMVMSDIIYAAGSPGGWALIPDPTEKERRFLETKDIEIVQADIPDLLAAAGLGDSVAALIPEGSEVGC
ncbi:SIR2 family protein [Thiocystis violacea]|uniref:SIR2 family protein n=1 Tax=Thiocystis violacea TaxID=13725 RepID=UPI0019037452|nr:SIR2 family protein [Thiocystis violacea]MBK1721766.1 SIR2 family protein [Thiocystis violacea]